MEHFEGRLRLAGEVAPVQVAIDLTDDQHLRISTDNVEIGDWTVGEVAVRAAEDGFHMLADGEELIINTNDDPAFAIAMGIRNAPPILRKQISDRLRYDPHFHEADESVQ